jgi:NAD-dependent deacetylase
MTTFSEEALDRLVRSRRVAVLTGAGASAESGIPTFRDLEGLWSKYDPAELATPSAFQRDPVRVQSWYSARIEAVARAKPNACHTALVALEDLVDRVTVLTQNVDGLHRRAGSKNVVELHGRLTDVYCASCGSRVDTLAIDKDAVEPTRCTCGGLIRPGVVWFGEMLPPAALDAAFEAAVEADVFLSIGTGAEVYPAAALPVVALESGAYVLEINVNRTAVSNQVDELVLGPAATLVPHLVELLTARLSPASD